MTSNITQKAEHAQALEASAEPAGQGVLGSQYARSKQEMMTLINQIRATGIAAEVDLPTIVVAGDQSCGKSSLIEAISGINLPRSVGTCTRVPIEVRLRYEPNEAWRCAVKTRQEVKSEGGDKDNQKPEKDFGLAFHDPAQVEVMIRRAQLALLNPTEPMETFVNYELARAGDQQKPHSKAQLAFSQNVIVLEISGPTVTDLTLVDLPGIIHNVAEGEDERDIVLIENMVKSYIAKPCLILLVITVTNDIRNQAAVGLAKKADPEGERILGVLTKVDSLGTQGSAIWLDTFLNKTESLAHGYHATRQPNDEELVQGILFKQARENERVFFNNTDPWSGLDSREKGRLGTENLTAYLSDQLIRVIREQLPELVQTIDDRFQAVTMEIEGLGKAPSENATAEMLDLITAFTTALKAQTAGSPGSEAFIQKVNEACLTFKSSIWATAPRFSPFTENERGDLEDYISVTASDIEEFRDSLVDGSGNDGHWMDLDDVREFIKKSVTRELRNNVPYPAKVRLIGQSLSSWDELSLNLLNAVRPVMMAKLDEVAKVHFDRYQGGKLPSTVKAVVQESMDELVDAAHRLIVKVLSWDARPFTMNDHYLSDVQAKILAKLKGKRHRGVNDEDNDVEDRDQHITDALASLTAAGINVDRKLLETLHPTDEFEPELLVMAEVRAYWQVAYKRLIDNVPRIIDAELIIPAADSIHARLLRELGVTAQDAHKRCAFLLAESSSTQCKRAALMALQARLGDARAAIKTFGQQ